MALALAAGGGWLVHDGVAGPGGPPAAAAPPAQQGDGPSAASPAPTVPPLPAAAPTRIRIPAIRVDAPVSALGLGAARQLETPPMEQRNLAGWYREGPAPGAAGNAILVGHADNRSGPAVFYRLGLLRPGDAVQVARTDGRTAVFTVDSVRVLPKKDFPDGLVYGATERAELRIITCGGRFDRRTGYEANTVVFAHLSSAR
ncbi:class F sortase [Kitasatospora sp. MMS16-BH015]|uniref:class F sortase n=1 Tax=Kitasatospora sp. MMS16-BH015 TaxID=2018025 RepID=UPI000CA11250|nr:class F sortase [Kitasatospora sp. MMS16-BH015]AUG82016.1 class F sortase [Kitasatospora sp. MMS16-BH015]